MLYSPLYRLNNAGGSGGGGEVVDLDPAYGTIVSSENIITITITQAPENGDRIEARYREANNPSEDFVVLTYTTNLSVGAILSGTLPRGRLYVVKLTTTSNIGVNERDGSYFFINIMPSVTSSSTSTSSPSVVPAGSTKYRVKNLSKFNITINNNGTKVILRAGDSTVINTINIDKTNIVSLSQNRLISYNLI